MLHPRSSVPVTAMATLLALLGCDEPGGVACTAEFRAITLVITDNAGAPADSVNLAVTLVRTGERLDHAPLGPHPEGTYPLIDDGATTKLRASGDQVQAVATKGAAVAQADFVIAVPGGCHVDKLSGPDTLTLP
jgi:hypothetical protein